MAIHKLTDLEVKKAGAGTLTDGAGLVLLTETTGRKYWKWRKFQGGKSYEFGVGAYPTCSLADARKKAAQLRIDFDNGMRPGDSTEKKRVHTFDDVAQQTIKMKSAGMKPKQVKQWENSLKKYASPAIGEKEIGRIVTADIVKILFPIWETKTETASRVRSRIEAVIDFACASGYMSGQNPARIKGNLEHILAPIAQVRVVEHHPAMPYQDIPAFMRELTMKTSISAYALQVLIHTACRTTEIREAEWAEFDFKNKVWIIPKERMKASVEHRVPLTERVIKIIHGIPRLAGNKYVFYSTKPGKCLSNGAMLMLLRGMGHGVGGDKSDAVVHGFRSSFRDWGSEETEYSNQMLEKAIAHKIKDAVEAAYRRGDLLEKRRSLMKDWSDYIDTRNSDF